ncbi:conserved hypothetical protein [Lebetimonas natsushimae]|uniref:diguanylate cyclase n=1 Tax=Lebetimonas natsushimae TaxID=1936991 RepID=A0A292YD48_9BACT|nr:response regulator [Lebetimonas natsushimae]GAX87235.1 conserved hypothetical protein [Lebetimonas natsushimae]
MKILILDDDVVYGKLVKNYLQKFLLFADIELVTSFKEAKKYNEYDLFIIDYMIPDCKHIEHIEYFLNLNKKVILITAYEKELIADDILNKVLDYVFKDNASLVYLRKLINRIYKNQFFNVMVVDDSAVGRKSIINNLGLLGFKNIIEARNGIEALSLLKKENFNIIITDLHMPKMNGFELVKEIRKEIPIEEIPILVLSSDSNNMTLIKTLKIGANDFILKSFKKEEFFIRLNNLLDIYDTFNLYKTKMYIDPLTGAYNRLYLEIIKSEITKWSKYTVIMLDIDHFKKVNDTYGHLKGDAVLKHFVGLVKSNIRKNDYLIRYGGEEFLIILPEADKKVAIKILQKIKVKSLTSDFNIKYTFSAGVADEKMDLIEKIKLADERLYKAKESGRDKFVLD